MRVEDLVGGLVRNDPVSLSEVMIAINVVAGRDRFYCHAQSMHEAAIIIQDGIDRGVLWGTVEAAFANVANTP